MSLEMEDRGVPDYKALVKLLKEQRDDFLKLKERRAARKKARDAKDKEKEANDSEGE